MLTRHLISLIAVLLIIFGANSQIITQSDQLAERLERGFNEVAESSDDSQRPILVDIDSGENDIVLREMPPDVEEAMGVPLSVADGGDMLDVPDYSITDSPALGLLDVSLLEEDTETALAAAWAGSDDAELLRMLTELEPRLMTPAEKRLLYWVIGSPVDVPGDEDSRNLLTKRADTLLRIGKPRAALRLFAILAESDRLIPVEEVEEEEEDDEEVEKPFIKSHTELAVDLHIALARFDEACQQVDTNEQITEFWVKLRIVCGLIDNDLQAVGRATEVADTEEIDDPWFFENVQSFTRDRKTTRLARFDSGMSFVMSVLGKLNVPSNAFISVRPDLSAIFASFKTLPIVLRTISAGISAEAGVLNPEIHREVYQSLIGTEGFVPSNAIEEAFRVLNRPSATVETKAQALSSALKESTNDVARFEAVARLLADYIGELPRNEITEVHALEFASAFIAVEDYASAWMWLNPNLFAGGAVANAFDKALLDGVVVTAGGVRGSPIPTLIVEIDEEAVANRLLETVDRSWQRSRIVQLTSTWSSFGYAIPVELRQFLSNQRGLGDRSLSSADRLRISSAVETDAVAEVVLLALRATKNEPNQLNPSDFAFLLSALRQVGAEEQARRLAIEASEYWKWARR